MIKTVNVASIGAGSKVAAASVLTRAQWISIQSDPDNGGDITHGDSDVSASQGHVIAPGGGGGAPQYPAIGGQMAVNAYDLRELYIYFENADDHARIVYCVR